MCTFPADIWELLTCTCVSLLHADGWCWLQLEEDPNVCEAILIHCLSFLPGWVEKNFQVGKFTLGSSESVLTSVFNGDNRICNEFMWGVAAGVWQDDPADHHRGAELQQLEQAGRLRCHHRAGVCDDTDWHFDVQPAQTSLRAGAKYEFHCAPVVIYIPCYSRQVDKVSDPKLKTFAGDLLSVLAEAVGPQFVATQLHKKATLHKSPKVTDSMRFC